MELEMPTKKEKKAKIVEQERRNEEIKTKLVKLDYSYGELAKIIPKSKDGQYPYEKCKIREKLMMYFELEEVELNEELKKDFEKCVQDVYGALLSINWPTTWQFFEHHHPDTSQKFHQLVTKNLEFKMGVKVIDLQHGQFAKMVSKSATGCFEKSDIKKALLEYLEVPEKCLSLEVKKKLEACAKTLCDVMNQPASSKYKEKINMKLPLELLYQSKEKCQPDKMAEKIFEKYGTTEQARLMYYKKMYEALKLHEASTVNEDSAISNFDSVASLEKLDPNKIFMTQFEEMLPKSEGGFYHESQIRETLMEFLKINKQFSNDLLEELLTFQVQLLHYVLNCEKHLKNGFGNNEECYINSDILRIAALIRGKRSFAINNYDEIRTQALTEFLEEYLEKLTTKECFRVAQDCFTCDLPVSLMKKPSQLKARILEKAESDNKSLDKMLQQSGQALQAIYQMFYSMNELSRPELVEVKKALGMSAKNTHSRSTLKNYIVNNLRTSFGHASDTLKEIINKTIVKEHEKMELGETHDVEMVEPPKHHIDEISIALGKPISLEDVLAKLNTLPSDQLKNVAVQLKIKASESLLKRPLDLKEKIKGVIQKDQNLLKNCWSLCSHYTLKNTDFEALGTEFSRSELFEICKFYKIDVDLHSNKEKLASIVKRHMIANELSLVSLMNDMSKRNKEVSTLSDYLKTLQRPKLLLLKDHFGKSSKGTRSSDDLRKSLTKLAVQKDLIKKDFQDIVAKSEMAKDKLQYCVMKDLEILDYEVLVSILKHIAPEREPCTDPFQNHKIRSHIFEKMKNDEQCKKFMTIFFDYNNFTLSSHLGTLSEMSVEQLKTTALDLGLEPLKIHLVFERQALTFKIIEYFKKTCFQDFSNFVKLDKMNYSLDDYFNYFEARHSSEPEWYQLEFPHFAVGWD